MSCHYVLLDLMTEITFGERYNVKLITLVELLLNYFRSLNSKHSPQHTFRKLSPSIFVHNFKPTQKQASYVM